MQRPALVLASESPRRLALLEQIGLKPDHVEPAALNESVIGDELPRVHSLRIAKGKAMAVFERLGLTGGHVILAADTVVACGRRILPKAETDEQVARCLALLSGRRHSVWTAICVVDRSGKVRTRVCETKVAFRLLPSSEIAEYVQAGEGLGKAGGYAIQGRAAVFVKFIQGSYSSVVGLPLMETAQMLRSCGVH